MQLIALGFVRRSNLGDFKTPETFVSRSGFGVHLGSSNIDIAIGLGSIASRSSDRSSWTIALGEQPTLNCYIIFENATSSGL